MNKINDAVTYVGILNPGLRVFDIVMRTDYGTTYNSYLVTGSEKTALIEAAHLTFHEHYMEQLKKALCGGKIDYLVLNHCEPDHTGCVSKLLAEFPDLTIFVSQAGATFIKNITNNSELKLQIAKDGDVLSLGDKTLQFLSAPFLHWPDSMFTYLPEDKLLFSCDFFGSHYCEPQLFDTRVVYKDSYWDAFKLYYDAIFGPFPAYVIKGLDIAAKLEIDTVCTSHGPVLTKDGLLSEVIAKYREWAAPVTRSNKFIPIFYCSAYGNTGLLAEAVQKGIMSAIPDANAPVYNLIENDMGEMCGKMNSSDAFLIGSPTLNRDAVPPVWQLLSGIDAINIQKRPVALFGTYGWSGEALGNIAVRLGSVKANVFEKQLKATFVPSAADLEAAFNFGAEFALTL